VSHSSFVSESALNMAITVILRSPSDPHWYPGSRVVIVKEITPFLQ
jgi:hypothetical protein